MAALNDKEKGKQAAALLAVDQNVKSGSGSGDSPNQIIGIGSGSTIVFAVQRIAELYASKQLSHIICVPTSFQSEQLILAHQLPLGPLKQFWNIDIDIDGADEVDAQLNCIKGGGGCHLMEKMVAFNAKRLVIIADDTKQSQQLCQRYKKGVPVSFVAESIGYLKSVIPQKLTSTVKSLKDREIVCNLRMAQKKAGPVITDAGNMIYDVDFGGELPCADVAEIDAVLHAIPGVVETGLFVGMAQSAYFGRADGSVIKQTSKGSKTVHVKVSKEDEVEDENKTET